MGNKLTTNVFVEQRMQQLGEMYAASYLTLKTLSKLTFKERRDAIAGMLSERLNVWANNKEFCRFELHWPEEGSYQLLVRVWTLEEVANNLPGQDFIFDPPLTESEKTQQSIREEYHRLISERDRLNKEIDKLQDHTCKHPNAVRKANGDSGNYDPHQDSSWTDMSCPDCGVSRMEDHKYGRGY